ncbi:uncharacterized protein CXQ87_004469 [Candidozyma duobushaemuli]|uniref:Uncharacterized protein n=1 Tax=Candidozyma duobushaemuli TaxID=1231522 RepID=A0A2V1AJ32_9ASCO|nr:uncharacterized protein CXQ87_004469 [[Candida] duobushaemulonis]PVH16911.1 hypothetical protein CXQ87_004469 [[Candida] duobushaemulonis]
MDREATQDILNKYLETQSSAEECKPYIEEGYESDPLMDLSNYSMAGKKAPQSRFTSPAKSYDSPTKQLQRLRGSPSKQPSGRFQDKSRSTVQQDFDLSFLDDLESISNDQFHANKHEAYTFLPDTKYSSFISNSAMKLRKALQAEQEKNKILEQTNRELEIQLSEAHEMRTSHDRLISQVRGLQDRNEELEMELRGKDSKLRDSSLSQENVLLRSKLVKYKTLYESCLKEHADDKRHLKAEGVPAQAKVDKVFKEGLAVKGDEKINSKELKVLLEGLSSFTRKLEEANTKHAAASQAQASHRDENDDEFESNKGKINEQGTSEDKDYIRHTPNSSSTPHVENEGNDATRNLMGKYNWNKTL